MRQIQNVLELENVPLEKTVDHSDPKYKSLEVKQGKLALKKVNMRYREDRELVLRELDFTVDAGLKVGIVGRTGAGKSSISNAITRIVELESGSIEIDDQNIGEKDLNELRSQVTVIP